MEATIADKLNEIRNLDSLARKRRKELEAQLSKLSQERAFHLDLANQRKKEIRELREGFKELPSVQAPDLAAAILGALDGVGPKTLRELVEMTGLKSKAISQCLQTLVRRGFVARILEEGRKRGASYQPVASKIPQSKQSADSAGQASPMESLSFPL
jgi:DNA-binding HxlR family transcriptional regulator